jgi:multidrug efflux system membrane fusion protein
VQRGPAGAYVYVVQSNNTVERRPIQVGHQDEDVAVVTAGLRPGDRVVTDGASRLMDGSRISVQDSTSPAVQTAPQAEGRQRASAAP